jgi:hypothetical protein
MTQAEQQHPLWSDDRALVTTLLQADPQALTDYHLAELARLTIRYRGFPGARDIQGDLTKLLQRWQFTEAELYQKTRAIHENRQVYRKQTMDQEDWT